MKQATLDAIKAHAERQYPRECCGVVIVVRGKERYVECRNIADSDKEFLMHPEDYAAAEDAGEVTCIVHSHCDASAQPSQPDMIGCAKSQKPWLIMGWPSGVHVEMVPSGYRAPLLGREFHHGVLDCYSLIRDYYAETLGIELPDFEREEEWWEKGYSLYLDHFAEAGFARVDNLPGFALKKHDVVIMQIASPVPNHAGVYIGDSMIIQHLMKRLSSRDVYGGWYRKCTAHVVRHESQM